MDLATVDNTQLNDAIKALNELVDDEGNLHIGTKVKYVASKKEDRISNFTAAYEDLVAKIYDEDNPLDLTLPDVVTDFYTFLYPEVADSGGEAATEETNTSDPDAEKKVAADKKAADKKAKADKKAADKKAKAAKKGPSEVKVFLGAMIAEEKWTRKQIIDKAVAKFPDKAKSTISTYISDGFSEKYCPFPNLIVITKDDEFLKFGKKKG